MLPKTILAVALFARWLSDGAASRVNPKANNTVLHAVGASGKDSEAVAAVAAINAVEQALHGLTSNPKMSPEMVGAAKNVSREVEVAAQRIEAGNMTKADKMKLVGHAIMSLQNLQAKWEKDAKDALDREMAAEDKEKSAADRIAELKKELEAKKALLAEDQGMLKAAKMQKQLLEQAEKAEGGAGEEARQQQAELASLEAMAKSMAKAQPGHDKAHSEARSKVPPSLEHIVADLRARANNLTMALERLDAEEKARETEMDKAATKPVPTQGGRDATQQGQKVLTMLKKQVKRTYKKARAIKAAELKELNEAIGNIEKGNIKALAKLMSKMEHESKQLSAKSKHFLY